jgi:leucyl/phenylalanyl-tRNA--protein transferase
VAAGGRVTPARLLEAYRQGIFPWYSPGQPVLWWSPDPRMVLPVAEFQALALAAQDAAPLRRTPGCEMRCRQRLRAR